MTDKDKNKTSVDVVQGMADDITFVPSQYIDATAVPIVGGLVTRHYVEIAEEMLADEHPEFNTVEQPNVQKNNQNNHHSNK